MDSDGVDPDPLAIRLTIKKDGTDLHFDFSESSPPCRGPLNSVIATTKAAVYLAVKHVFPDVPINAGCFEPLKIADPHGTFLYARYPRPVSGCAAEVSSRIAESVFTALARAIPDDLFAAPAGTSGNLTLGGFDPLKERHYIMYVFSGGGYGGSAEDDGLTNGCSTIGISKTQPAEVLEQHYPILFERYALRERSGGAGQTRGGFGVDYTVRIRRGEALLSFLMDHGRFGPPGLFGGQDGACNEVVVERQGVTYRSPHWSKDEDIRVGAGDSVHVRTPGGGGYGDPLTRDPELVRRDVARGYLTAEDAERDYGVVVTGDPLRSTRRRRSTSGESAADGAVGSRRSRRLDQVISESRGGANVLLDGKACVVTGASRGLGRAIALAFAEQGADVVLAARTVPDLEQLGGEIEAMGRRAVVAPTDVTDLAQLRALAETAAARLGRLDVWVNNAGGDPSIPGGWAEWLDVTEAGWERMLALNLKAQVFGAQAAARVMRARGSGGAIIFLSSIDSLYAAPGGEGIYGACKAAINNITQTMAVELGQHGIRVNAIAPAVVETPLTAPWLATPEDRRKRSAFYPLRRVGQPPDVAAAAVYFASDEAAWVSGAVLLVSGGAVMTSDPYRYLMRVNRGE